MTVSFKTIADLSDAYDAETKKIGESRKEMWANARAHLSPVDVRALKDAIRLRRQRLKEGDAVVDAHDSRVFEILAEITPTIGHARAPSEADCVPAGRVTWLEGVGMVLAPLGAVPPHNPSTGELIEEPETASPVTVGEEGLLAVSRAAGSHGDASPTLSDTPSQQVADETLAAGGALVSAFAQPSAQEERIRCGVPMVGQRCGDIEGLASRPDPANISSDDPGPIPAGLDRRKQMEAA